MDSKHIVAYYKNTNIISREIWELNEKLHKEDGSAKICYYENESKFVEIWYDNEG